MNNFYRNNPDVHQSNDIESQTPEPRRVSRTVSGLRRIRSESEHCNKYDYFAYMRSPSIQTRRKINFYEQKLNVYKLLHRPPRGLISAGYHIFVTCIILTCLVLTVLSTISDYATPALGYLKIMDCFVLAFFSAELMVRFWSSGCISYYRGWKGKFRFFRNPFRLIDLFIIYSTVIVLLFDDRSVLVFTSLRGIRFLQIFQVLKLEHRFGPWRMMTSVIWAQREHLAIIAYMGSLILLSTSFLIYFLEKDVNPAFNNWASSLWWGVVTLCTIGYGDMYPITPIGKLLSCICFIVGVSIFALPAGILSTGLALKVQEQQRLRQLSKRKVPAARLIQCVWRCYVADKKSMPRISLRRSSKSKTKIHRKANPESNALKFILVVKYFIARRNFSKASKPYDIKDVLEQYAAGHTNMLTRVKQMESRMDTIEEKIKSNFNTMQELKVLMSLRMSKVEQLLKDSHIRLNDLIEVHCKSDMENAFKDILCRNQNQIEFRNELSMIDMPLKKRRMSL